MNTVSAQSATIWTFRRRCESARIARFALPNGRWCLLIDGPGAGHRYEECEDAVVAVRRQLAEERALIAQGYHLERLASDEGAVLD